MCEDFHLQGMSELDALNACASHVDRLLSVHGKSWTALGLPAYERADNDDDFFGVEVESPQEASRQELSTIAMLNQQQKQVFDEVEYAIATPNDSTSVSSTFSCPIRFRQVVLLGWSWWYRQDIYVQCNSGMASKPGPCLSCCCLQWHCCWVALGWRNSTFDVWHSFECPSRFSFLYQGSIHVAGLLIC